MPHHDLPVEPGADCSGDQARGLPQRPQRAGVFGAERATQGAVHRNGVCVPIEAGRPVEALIL